jgi:hypothetical protein
MGWLLVYFVTVAVPLPTAQPAAYSVEARVMEFAFTTQQDCLSALHLLQQSRAEPNAGCWRPKDWKRQKRLNHYASVGPGEYPVVAP